MIVVIADDFTGAAEIGGIGLRYNLDVELDTEVNLQSKADLLIIATDTRSMKKEEAEQEMQLISRQIAQLKPTLIFKKVDSVLRGYVVEELVVHLRELGLNKALLVPANPQFGRIVKNGQYFVNGQLIHLTHFAKDPEFAVKTSEIKEMLYKNSIPVHVQHQKETLKLEGIIVGEAEHEADLQFWASQHNETTLAAGAAGFFTALLEHNFFYAIKEASAQKESLNYPALMVAGSSYKRSAGLISNYQKIGFSVNYMPDKMIFSSAADDEMATCWCNEIVADLQKNGKAVTAVHPDAADDFQADSQFLRQQTATMVARVFEQVAIQDLMIEGGSTAAAVFKKLNLTSFIPVEELAPGVIRMKSRQNQQLNITLKPGSYAWPTAIIKCFF